MIVFCIQVPVWTRYYMSSLPTMDSSQLRAEMINVSILTKQSESEIWNKTCFKVITYLLLQCTDTYRLVWYPISKYVIFVSDFIMITWNGDFIDRHVGQAPFTHGDPPTRAVVAHHHLSSHRNQIVATANREAMQWIIVTRWNRYHSNLHTPLISSFIYY
jgi:hypothetical protein